MKMWSFEDRNAPFVHVFRRSAALAGYDLKIIMPAGEPSAFVHFKSVYQHLSRNSERFELACFRRWFEIAAVVTPQDRFVFADSDLYIQSSFKDLPLEIRETEALVGSIASNKGIPEDMISPHFSVWTGKRLRQFCEYMIAFYEETPQRPQAICASRLQNGHAWPMISDMTLLHLWVTESNVSFLNSNYIINDGYIDHNLSVIEASNGRFKPRFGCKALDFQSNGCYLILENGQRIWPHSLHLVGRCKKLAEAIETQSQVQVDAIAAYIWCGRTANQIRTRLSRKLFL